MKQVANPELEKFNDAMDTILKADPKSVKNAMIAEKKKREEQRKMKDERKGGKRSDKSQ